MSWRDTIKKVDKEIDKPKGTSWKDTIQPIESESKMSGIEAGAVGAAQGLTANFADEIAGAVSAGTETLFGDDSVDKQLREQGFKLPEESIYEKYKTYRDAARRQYEQAQKDQPGSALAGEIVGGIAPALATGGSSALAQQGLKEAAKQSAKAGAKFGAITGLGRSEDITDIPETLKEVGTDTLTGAALGGAFPILSKGAQGVSSKAKDLSRRGVNVLRDEFPTLDKMISAASRSTQGEKLTGSTMSEVFSKEMDDAILNLSDDLKEARNIIGDAQSKILKKGKQSIDISNDVDQLITRLEKQSEGITSSKAKGELQDLITKFKGLRQSPEVITQSGEDVAFQKLTQKRNNMIKDLEAKEGIILDPQNTNFSDIKVDRDGGRVFFRDNTTGKTYSQRIGKDVPLSEQIIENKVSVNASKAHEIASDMYKASQDFETSTASNLASKLFGQFKDKVRTAMGSKSAAYDQVNKKYNLLKNAEELLKPGFSSGNAKERQSAQQALANLADNLTQETNLTTKRAFRQFFDMLESDFPSLVKNNRDKILNIAEKIDINQAALGTAGRIAGDVSRLAGTLESYGIRGAIGAGKAVGSIKSLINMPKQQLQQISNQFVKSDNQIKQRLGNTLNEMANSSQTRRNALMFSLSQNPAFKKMLEEELGVDFTNNK